MSLDSAPQGTLQTALEHTHRLLAHKPALAEEQAREILKSLPGNPDAELLLAMALKEQHKPQQALAIVEALAAKHPFAAAVQYALGLIKIDLGEQGAAQMALREATRLDPGHSAAWRALGDLYTLAGNPTAADAAYAQNVRAAIRDPDLMQAAGALCEGQLDVAERLLRPFLKEHPTDVAAIRMLAEIGGRLGRLDEAEALLQRALELAPSFDAARHHYAIILHRHNKPDLARVQIDTLLRHDPRNAAYRILQASILARLGEHEQAIAAYRAVLADHPRQPKAWMSLGHTLKAAGHSEDSIAAYRRSIAEQPSLGEAYWSLANLKTFRFDAAEISAMQTQLQRHDISAEDRLHLHFALGKALEDEQHFEASFRHYQSGNDLRRKDLEYRAEDTEAFCDRLKTVFTPEFFAARAGWGCQAADPIFIVGLPRSGSTLVEQILASHSAVEGTSELPDIMAIARRLGGKDKRIELSDYPNCLNALTAADCTALGEEYLSRTRIQRKTARPMFIDKMPNNFLHSGLIHLILPRAKIIDVRRGAMGCCFSCFKQHFARGQGFTYSLDDIGRYYAAYVGLMAHYHRVLPGRITPLRYEGLVADPETQVRTLLSACGLDFEDGSLHFYNNPRPVRTASAEQVRQPIYRDGIDHWRAFSHWLNPLKDALGPILAED